MDDPSGYRHLALNNVASTNSECMQLFSAGDAGKIWVTATQQLQGRGRLGRKWISKPGNLYASLLLVDPAEVELSATLPFVASLAVRQAVSQMLPNEISPNLKWPNDVLINGAKISGILLEGSTDRDGRHAVVIGCGINCAHQPDDLAYDATCIRALNGNDDTVALFLALSKSMAQFLEIWNRGKNFEAVRDMWMEHAHPIGTTINARSQTPQGIKVETGTFDGLTTSGHLRLKQGDAIKEISAADIFFAQEGQTGHKAT